MSDPIAPGRRPTTWDCTPKLNADGTPNIQQGHGSKLLSPIIRDQIIAALQRGATRSIAASYAGISNETLRSALARGRAEDSPEPWRSIYIAVETAEAEAAVASLQHVDLAQKDDWKAAAWRLERTRPHEYGRQITEILVGKQNVTEMSTEEHDAVILTYVTGRLKDLGREDLAEELRKVLK